MKTVSVIITCYNYGQYLGQCITSVLQQTYQKKVEAEKSEADWSYQEIEIIVVDDHSDAKETIEQLVKISDHCRVIWHSERRGLAAAANTGIAVAKGELVMRLDADDWLGCEHIELLEKSIKGDISAAYSDYWSWDEKTKHEDAKVVPQGKIPLGSCMLFKKVLWEKIGGYDESLEYQEDVDFFKRLEKLTSFYHLCMPTWYYRKHDKQMSMNHNAKMKVRENILNHSKILTVIPARGNSKGVEHKNLRKINNLTLVERAIRMVKESGITTQIVVSSEDKEIRHIAEKEGVDYTIHRPKYLSEDDVSTISVVKHATDLIRHTKWIPEIIISVQPTCPFTPPEALAEGVEKLIKDEYFDSVVSISKVHKHPYRIYAPTKTGLLYPYMPEESEKYLQRQDRPKAYGFTGGFYIRRRALLDNWDGKGFALGNCSGIEVSQIQGIDIDTETDLLIAQRLGKFLKCI